MKIGIDLDDTICRTTEIVHKKLKEYAENINLNPLDIMNDESLKEEFFQKELKSLILSRILIHLVQSLKILKYEEFKK